VNPHQVTREFECAVAAYCGAPFAVAVNSCTNAIFLSLMWYRRQLGSTHDPSIQITLPARTYVSVPMQVVHAGFRPLFIDFLWRGSYEMFNSRVVDSARLFTSGMYQPGTLMCTSHHWSKTLGLQQAGCILTDDAEAVAWLKRARFDGRSEGIPPAHDDFTFCGWHMYLSPEISALGLMKLSILPKHNDPLPNDDYPDLSKLSIFGENVAKAIAEAAE
jgi:dTDP-4-amino-4,6-dideoxygalactose transaminase